MFKKLRIRPDEQGTRVALFDLEAEIMDRVWSRGWEAFSVRQVCDLLEEERDIAYTTVMTTVKRLHDKGLLERHRDGRRYLYSPVMDRETFHTRMAVEVMRSLPPSSRAAAVSMLIDELSEGDADTLDRLEALIAARKEREGE
ncbi:MAG: BlaI/MecI/CopY family transcriptional regulator [Myxococcota bacterium]